MIYNRSLINIVVMVPQKRAGLFMEWYRLLSIKLQLFFDFSFLVHLLSLMHLSDALGALVKTAVESSGDGEGTTDDGADTGQEAGERLEADLAVVDLHCYTIELY